MRWNNIKNMTPAQDEWTLGATIGSQRVYLGVWLGEDEGFRIPDCGYLPVKITHWMPMPAFNGENEGLAMEKNNYDT